MSTNAGSSTVAEWDAATYHRISNPHMTWGARILARLPLRGDETVVDAGCGSGRLTAELLDRLPRGHVIAVDRSANMLAAARANLAQRYGDRVTFIQGDLAALALAGVGDAIFSGATFHWVPDHPRLFAALYRTLKPGGRLVAQCGGAGNLAHLVARADALMADPRFAPSFADWPGPWQFAGAATTADRLRAAGFRDVATDLEAAPVYLADAAAYREFLAKVIFGEHLARLPDEHRRAAFVETLTDAAAGDTPPFALDYVRLNMQATRP